MQYPDLFIDHFILNRSGHLRILKKDATLRAPDLIKTMKRLLLLNLVFMCMLHAVSAQNFNFGDLNFAELDMKKYPKDTSAHAVVLNEYGRARITIVNDDKIRLVYEYHVRTK